MKIDFDQLEAPSIKKMDTRELERRNDGVKIEVLK